MADAEPDGLAEMLAGLADSSWIRKTDALRIAAARLASGELAERDEQRIAHLLAAAAQHPKWEVRKATAVAFAECRQVSSVKPMLEALARDENRWVSQAAARALERVELRSRPASDWALSAESQDPTLHYIMERIREIGLRSMTPARIYSLAVEIGEQSYRELAADTAHELRTLLTPFEGYLAELKRHLGTRGPDAAAEHYVAAALGRLEQIRLLTENLRAYSSPSDADFAGVDVEIMVRDAIVVGLGSVGSTAAPIEQVIDIPAGLLIQALRERLVRALANLIANACQAMPHGGTLSVSARRIDARETEAIQITVNDTGRGMTPEMIDQARMRFRTTRRDEGGTGLGVPIAERIIVHDHGGELSFDSALGKGTTVTIVLPMKRPPNKA